MGNQFIPRLTIAKKKTGLLSWPWLSIAPACCYLYSLPWIYKPFFSPETEAHVNILIQNLFCALLGCWENQTPKWISEVDKYTRLRSRMIGLVPKSCLLLTCVHAQWRILWWTLIISWPLDLRGVTRLLKLVNKFHFHFNWRVRSVLQSIAVGQFISYDDRVTPLSRLHRPFMIPMVAILEFTGCVTLQAVRKCHLCRLN